MLAADWTSCLLSVVELVVLLLVRMRVLLAATTVELSEAAGVVELVLVVESSKAPLWTASLAPATRAEKARRPRRAITYQTVKKAKRM